MAWQDFDFEGRLKVPIGFYLILLYSLRGYFIWLMSISHRKEPGLIISLVYPDPKMFLATLLIGLPVLLVYILMLSKGRINKSIEMPIWRKSQTIVGITLLVDLSIQAITLWQNQWLMHFSAPLTLMIGIYLLWYWFSSQKVKRFVALWLD